jgi:FkbM family methyltransferase
VTAPDIVSTSRLFAALLRPLGISVVCDVGSLNGADALRFRRALPQARILAFEANPQNLAGMRQSTVLREARIEVLGCAAADREGVAEFFVVPVQGPEMLARRGMSSLYQRADPDKRGVPVTVPTRRLDRVLTGPGLLPETIALWIDAEGAAFEVLTGADGILDRVALIHVEVETRPCIGRNQKLHHLVARMLAARGFEELAIDAPAHEEQFNALYVRAHLPRKLRAAVRRRLRRARLHRWLDESVLAACPARVRAWLYRRRHTPRALA